MTKQANAKVLIADDESAITTGLSAILEDAGYGVEVVGDGQKALDKLTGDRYGVVLADLKMPKLDGLTLLSELQQRQIPTECIIITGQATVDSAVQAMQQGAYDYIEKPLNAEKLNRLKALIPKALDKYEVQQKNRELASKLEGLTHYGELTGQSEAMRSVYQVIEAVAPSTASVLILGESGTGKELVARALHQKSDRSKGPFFALNCAALPKEILENLLFGHPDVVNAVVTPVPHQVKGLAPAAMVIVREGSGRTADELKQYCLEKGPAYSHPRYIDIVPALPLNGAGKVDRGIIQAKLTAAYGGGKA